MALLILPRRPPRPAVHSIPTLTPFLYPSFVRRIHRSTPSADAEPLSSDEAPSPLPSPALESHPHHIFTNSPFADLRTISLASGAGGNGCISFLRDKFISDGPANGGDGGTGGSIYIQAIVGETSLHKLGRQGVIKASDGSHGKGSSSGGKRGEDVVIQVPVGTVVREINRYDPIVDAEDPLEWQKWTHYPDSLAKNLADPKFRTVKFPVNHHRNASELLRATHPYKVDLDLSEPTQKPILLLPGSPGGLGNPHFVSTSLRHPLFATKGTKGFRMTIQLELKVLADIGLVGFPNAGKSSFLRAVSARKARVGDWAFTTLSPNIGTVMVDERRGEDGKERFTIADIPGLVEDAHLDKGLGLGFLRHVERARALAFVIDLSSPDPVEDLRKLWRELEEYETDQLEEIAPEGHVRWTGISQEPVKKREKKERMRDKKWLVIANKADLEGTREKFFKLKKEVGEGVEVVPISALRKEGVENALGVMKALLGV
ncbi:GTP-binding protein Obg/CgtA [Ascodesmis nigricans]|uniref:GTP-binding protein Obg/CgtA n=1 Tax=Ascodesmis nigricans TaxID=341454 RepID=A0A4S2N1F9_9PEZI|nr:GTP-binding protein Obg/CgtA [Ascodesmis nigricans]